MCKSMQHYSSATSEGNRLSSAWTLSRLKMHPEGREQSIAEPQTAGVDRVTDHR